MPKRVTVPEGHIALILPDQLSEELMALARQQRQKAHRIMGRLGPEDQRHHDANVEANILGDIMLALLEAKEA